MNSYHPLIIVFIIVVLIDCVCYYNMNITAYSIYLNKIQVNNHINGNHINGNYINRETGLYEAVDC